MDIILYEDDESGAAELNQGMQLGHAILNLD
jgi:hypothetical protein